MDSPHIFLKTSRKTMIVYDTSTGKIIHVHEVLALPGVTLPSESELESQARNMAEKSTGRTMTQAAVMHVRREDIKPDFHYEVDVKNKVLTPKNKIDFKKPQ
jgi:hypothetical protein